MPIDTYTGFLILKPHFRFGKLIAVQTNYNLCKELSPNSTNYELD